MSTGKSIVIYIRNVSLKKFTKPVNTLAHVRPTPKQIIKYSPPKKDITPFKKTPTPPTPSPSQS